MGPSKEYLDMIAKKLDKMNELSGITVQPKKKNKDPMLDFFGQLGAAGKSYMESKSDKKGPWIDPIFTDRNSY